MIYSFEARESVGYAATWQLFAAPDVPLDVRGWTFAASFERQAGATDFSLANASMGSQGFYIFDGETGRIVVTIPAATLAGVTDTTGDFTINGDLIGTPPTGPRVFLAAIQGRITKGPTA